MNMISTTWKTLPDDKNTHQDGRIYIKYQKQSKPIKGYFGHQEKCIFDSEITWQKLTLMWPHAWDPYHVISPCKQGSQTNRAPLSLTNPNSIRSIATKLRDNPNLKLHAPDFLFLIWKAEDPCQNIACILKSSGFTLLYI